MRDMRRHLACIASAACVFVAPAVAQAKEISKVSVCGPSGQCTSYDESHFKSLMFLAEDAGPTDPPAAGAPWYRVRFTVDMRDDGGGHDSWTVAYVPSADSLRVRDEVGDFAWVALSPRTAAVFKRAVRSLPAFPKGRLRGLHVEPRQARVDEVFAPARTAATRERIDSGTTPWGWIAGGTALAAALVLLVLVAPALRRRRHVDAAPGTAEPGRPATSS
jgi:MYXO-CTERM domain-containing protein